MGIPKREQFWNPQGLKYRFLAEAIRLWELESARVDLVTVQAATLLNLVYGHNGMDKIGDIYLNHALNKARQLDLFGDHATVDNERMFHARVFSAWALFNWQWYVCLFTFLSLIMPTQPPANTLLPSHRQCTIVLLLSGSSNFRPAGHTAARSREASVLVWRFHAQVPTKFEARPGAMRTTLQGSIWFACNHPRHGRSWLRSGSIFRRLSRARFFYIFEA